MRPSVEGDPAGNVGLEAEDQVQQCCQVGEAGEGVEAESAQRQEHYSQNGVDVVDLLDGLEARGGQTVGCGDHALEGLQVVP